MNKPRNPRNMLATALLLRCGYGASYGGAVRGEKPIRGRGSLARIFYTPMEVVTLRRVRARGHKH